MTEHDHDVCTHEVSSTINRRNVLRAAGVFALAAGVAGGTSTAAANTARTNPSKGGHASAISWYRLVPGFVEVVQDPWGRPLGTGFAGPNPWGAYTAYLIHVSKRGHRTWRVENMALTTPRQDGSQYAQGSTMWLFEGSERALLVDTAQNTPETIGVNDLKAVCHWLLSHEDDGKTVRPDPVDFDVAITHRHGDHTGKAFQMTDRTLYYPDLDWTPTTTAGPTWVPIRQGGGSTTNGSGQAVGHVDLGGRRIDAVAMYGHTPGSTGYLDAANLMLATGDAIGSAYVWAHFASATTTLYHDMLNELRRDLRPLKGLALLPAHFYQIKQFGRGRPPINGRPLDLSYLDDMARAAGGALDGGILGDPYHEIGREAVWISGGTARMVYSLTNLYPGGPAGGNGDLREFHGINIPSRYPQDPFLDDPYAFLNNIKTGLVMIRDSAEESSFLVRGTNKAVLITSGRAAPGLARYAQRLVRSRRLDVVLTSGDPAGIAGIRNFAGHDVWVPKGAEVGRQHRHVRTLRPGDSIDLGRDTDGRRVRLAVDALPGVRDDAVTLLDPVSRVLFAGDALGTQGAAGLTLSGSLEEFGTALTEWRSETSGAYDTLYTSHNHQWHTRPAYVDSIQTAVASEPVTSPRPGYEAYRAGTGEALAWVFVPT
ncbi:hypothetical protein [Mumia zhuanghuii]|uniref:hypothetical protein n=1 Tax=Mumia zhuanghuii TaxID=2585211 RepID=UPI00362F2A0F